MKAILLGLIVLNASACLGDDPDHLDAVGSEVTLSSKLSLGAGVPSEFHTRLLRTIETIPASPSTNANDAAGISLASNWSMTVDAPELCSDCTVSLLHDKMDLLEDDAGATNRITVWDDARSVNVCTILLRITVDAKAIILADTCGERTAESSPGKRPRQQPPILGAAIEAR